MNSCPNQVVCQSAQQRAGPPPPTHVGHGSGLCKPPLLCLLLSEKHWQWSLQPDTPVCVYTHTYTRAWAMCVQMSLHASGFHPALERTEYSV